MKLYLLVALGGFLGAICRYSLSGFIQSKHNSSFPFGTFIVNLIGSFVLGFLFVRHICQPEIILLFGVGFTGAYTTFSTFQLESVELIRKKKLIMALSYINVSVVLGVFLAYLGSWVGSS